MTERSSKIIINTFIFYLLFLPIVQAFFCINLKIIGVIFFPLVLVFYSLIDWKKFYITRFDASLVLILLLLNVFDTLIDSRGTVFFMPSYMIIISLLFSKIVIPNLSIDYYLDRINISLLIILFFLVLEFLIVSTIGSSIFYDNLTCHSGGVQGYKPIHNATSYIFSTDVAGLNSIMMGSQTSSELAAVISIWSIYKYKTTEKRFYIFTIILSLLMIILSPSYTSIFLLTIGLTLYFLFEVYSKNKLNIYWLNFAPIFVVLFSYLMYEFLLVRYPDLNIFSTLFQEHFVGFNYMTMKELLFGAHKLKIEGLFASSEFTLLTQVAKLGILGVTIFYGSIAYYMLLALTNTNATGKKERLTTIFILIIIVIFLLGNVHYRVMFQSGVRELFLLFLAYIMFMSNNSCKNSN